MKFATFSLLLLSLIGTAEAGLSYTDMKLLVREEGVKRTDRNLGITLSGEGTYTFAPEDRIETTEEEKVYSEQSSSDFSDINSGYCALDTFAEVEQLELLFNTDVAIVDDFMQGTEAISDLQGFVDLVRSFLPEDSSDISDRQILSSIMQQGFTGPTRALSQQCIDKIEDAFSESLVYFNRVLNVGDGLSDPDSDPATDDPVDDELIDTNTWPYLLQIIEQEASPTFDKFKDFMLGYYETFDARQYFDEDWRKSVKSWPEATLTGIAVVAKYAAVYLSDGDIIRDEFLALNMTSELEQVYDETVSLCRGTASPPDDPATEPGTDNDNNDNIPLIAVIKETSSTLTALDLQNSFDDLRASYPNRRLCLLQPAPASSASLKIPANFLSGGNIYKQVRSDGGSLGSISNWFDLCDLYEFSSDMAPVALYVSSSVASDIPASLTYFERQLARRDMSIIDAVGDGTTNWIEPFIRDFV